MSAITPAIRAAIEEYTAGVIRARIEYRFHPFAQTCNGRHRCPNRAVVK